MKTITKIIPAVAIAASVLASTAISANAAQSGAAQLHILLNSHVYMGQRFTQAAKNATGDPYIRVVDRRHTFGEVYRCSFSYRGNPRYRYVVCD